MGQWSGIAKKGLAWSLVAMLLATTALLSLAAAAGTAQVTLRVQYQGPRALDLSACDGDMHECPIQVEILTPDQVFPDGGAGYAYGYGYRFLEWLTNGYGYASFDTTGALDGETVIITISGLPSGSYLFRAFLDLEADDAADEDLEPLAFAEESAGDSVFDLALQSRSGQAVVAEAAADITGEIFLTDGASPLGADVTATGPFGDEYEGTIFADGSFIVSDVPSGLWYDLPYIVSVEKDGYTSDSQGVVLSRHGVDITDDFELTPLGTPVELPVSPGWNIVSLPVLPIDATAGTVFGSRVAYAWTGSGYDTLDATDELEVGRGYWLYDPVGGTISLTGDPFLPAPPELHLPNAGWHLIGGPFYEATIDGMPANFAPPLYAWDDQYVDAETLVPGQGYWALAVDGPATLPLLEEGSS